MLVNFIHHNPDALYIFSVGTGVVGVLSVINPIMQTLALCVTVIGGAVSIYINLKNTTKHK